MGPSILKNLPSVNELMEHAPLKGLRQRVSRNVVVAGARSFLTNLRAEVKDAAAEISLPTPSELAERIAQWIVTEQQPVFRPVINATGALLHPALGPPPLADAAVAQIQSFAAGYANVELNLETGDRAAQTRDVEKPLIDLTAAESAMVAAHRASGTMLALAAVASGREVIVSRGQLIEVDGSFRLPDVIAASGAVLREVGTANKTRIDDYEAAVGEGTAALMRVHGSHFAMVGATEHASLAELVALGRKKKVLVIDDLGSGALIDMSPYGLPGEPVAAESVKTGADVVLLGGDKLLGGPQCGIIVGRRPTMKKIAAQPMMQALRADKITLAALAATLRLYRDPQIAERDVPILSLLSTPIENLRNRAQRLAPQIAAVKSIASAEPVEATAFLHGGSVPTQQIPTWCIAVTPANGDLDALAEALRLGSPPVVGRVEQDRLLLDLRSVLPRQDIELVDAVAALDGDL